MQDFDPLGLSRDVKEAASRVKAWTRALRDGEASPDNPLELHRRVSSRQTFLELGELTSDDPLREPLRRWVHCLTEVRVDALAAALVAHEYRVELHAIDEPERGRLSLSAILAKALREPERREAWLNVYLTRSAPLSAAHSALWERRAEVLSRMGLGHREEIERLGVDARRAAEDWLSCTDDLFAEFRSPSFAAFLDAALGTDAREGWPNRLTLDSVMDWFRDTELFRALAPDPGPFCEVTGAASFLRALRRLGAAWADAAAPSNQPFVVAREPFGLRRSEYGSLFGALPASATFAQRKLGISRARLPDHCRALARLRLLESRAGALRVLVGSVALEGPRALAASFGDLSERALGFGLPKSAALAIFRPSHYEAQRFVGRFLAASRVTELRNAHDEDWYRNPRAAEQLRAEAALSPEPGTTEALLKAGAEALYAELAEALR